MACVTTYAAEPGPARHVLEAACPNVFFADNMKTCFGTQKKIGPETVPQFMVPWWYRADFTPGLQPGQTASLVVNGIVGQADVWVTSAPSPTPPPRAQVSTASSSEFVLLHPADV